MIMSIGNSSNLAAVNAISNPSGVSSKGFTQNGAAFSDVLEATSESLDAALDNTPDFTFKGLLEFLESKGILLPEETKALSVLISKLGGDRGLINKGLASSYFEDAVYGSEAYTQHFKEVKQIQVYISLIKPDEMLEQKDLEMIKALIAKLDAEACNCSQFLGLIRRIGVLIAGYKGSGVTSGRIDYTKTTSLEMNYSVEAAFEKLTTSNGFGGSTASAEAGIFDLGFSSSDT